MTVENISIDVKTNAGSAAKQFRSLSSALSGVQGASKSVTSSGQKTSKSVASVGHAAKSATGALGKLFSSIKRIAFYRLLRTFIKELSQAFQEGLKNVYAFSKAMNTGLAQALDRIASASGQMKNQMGAAFGELLYTLEPIITAIVSLITSLMRALSALFAALGGRMTYTVADKTAKNWDKAAGSAKEYKKTILGFDEINRLNDESGGGGGGDVSTDGLAEVELPDWAKLISEAIQRGAWGTAGKLLADHINEVIDVWDADEAGKKLGSKINDAIKFAFYFFKNLDAENIGAKIAGFINGALSKINTSMLGATLISIFTTVFDFAIGFLTNIDTAQLAKKISDFIKGAFNQATEWINSNNWGDIGKELIEKINDYLKNVDWRGITKSFSDFLISAFNGASDFVKKVDWKSVGKNLFTSLDEAIKGINFSDIATSFFTLFGNALVAAVKFAWGFVQDSIKQIKEYFLEFIRDENGDGHFGGGEIIKGLLEGIAQALVDVYFWIMEHVVHPIIKAFCDAFGIHSPSTVMRDEVGKFIGDGILSGILQPFKDIFNWIKANIFDPFISGFRSAFGIDGEPTTLINIGERVINGFLSGLKSAWQSVTSWISSAVESAKNALSFTASPTITVNGTTVNRNGFSHGPQEEHHFASGGFPSVGEVFIAREAGPELVGSINGHTAVANNDQIVEAVASGVYEAVSSAMSNTNERPMLVRVYLDGREIRTGQNRYAMAMGV